MAAQTQVKVIISAVDNATKVVKGVGKSISDFAKVTKTDMRQAGLIMAGLSASILMVGKSAISIASDLEQNRIAFETMTGSAEEAGKLLEKLSDFAVKTPFDMPGVIAAGKQLMAMGSGINDVIPDLKMLGDVAAGLGVPLQRLIINFGQVRMQGKLTGRELRDFAIAGVPLIDQLADSLGVAKDQIADMVSAGEIGFEDVKQAFIDMTSEGGKFNNLMVRQSKSLQGVIANTRDELIRFAAEVVGISKAGEIREGSLFAVLKDGAEKLLVALSALTPKAVEFTKMLMQNKTALMAVGGALLGLFIAPLVIATVLMAKAILIAGTVVTAFAAIGAIAGVIKTNWAVISSFFINIWTIVSTAFETAKNTITKAITDLWSEITTKYEEGKAFLETKFTEINKFYEDHKKVIDGVVTALVVFFIPAIVKVGVEAVIAGAKIAGKFIIHIVSIGIQAVITGVILATKLIFNIIKLGIQSAITGGIMAVRLIANVIKLGVQALITATVGLAQIIISTIKWGLEGWKVIAMIIMKIIKLGIATAAIILHTTVTIAQTTATIGLTAATWLLNAALAILTSPITLVVLAIVALIAIGVLLYKNWDKIKKEAIEKFDAIKKKVEEVVNFIRDLIDNFKPKISIGLDLPDIEGAWRNLKERARSAGASGDWQTGGVVPGPIGQPIFGTVHGGEVIKPAGVAVGASTGGSEINFNVYVGLYAGTETEKRNIARDLYVALGQVARSQDKTVQQLMGV